MHQFSVIFMLHFKVTEHISGCILTCLGNLSSGNIFFSWWASSPALLIFSYTTYLELPPTWNFIPFSIIWVFAYWNCLPKFCDFIHWLCIFKKKKKNRRLPFLHFPLLQLLCSTCFWEVTFHKHSFSWSSSPLKSVSEELENYIDHHEYDASYKNYCSESKVSRHHSWPFRLKSTWRETSLFRLQKSSFTEDFVE